MWVAEGWVVGQGGKAVKAQVTTPGEPDEAVIEQLGKSLGVLFFLTYRVWPDPTVKPGTKVYQR